MRPLTPTRVAPCEFQPFLERFETPDDHARVCADDGTAQLLARYRQLFDDQVVHDVDYNLQEISAWAHHQDAAGNDALVDDGCRRLRDLRDVLAQTDAWRTSQAELDCWNAFHQFYCDALSLAQRLLDLEHGRTRWGHPSRSPQRTKFPGASSNRRRQAVLNAIEQAVPDILTVRPLRGFLPVLAYQALRSVLPRPIWRSREYLTEMHAVLTAGTLASYGADPSPRVCVEGADEFLGNPDFFEPHSGRTRHNIIVAFSHRHSFLDLPLAVEALGDIEFASWSNIQYFPKSAALDPMTVSVKPGESRRMDSTLARSTTLLAERRVPLIIYVDGGSPYLPYGQQMRIKPGLRVLVDHLRSTARGGRSSFIVPVSFNDTVAFVRGLDSTLRVQFHPPIDVASVPAAPRPPRRDLPNRGDPLLNHLECLFLSRTGQLRHGWHTPVVIETARRAQRARRRLHGLRARLKRRFHASILDLCRAGSAVHG